MPIIMKNYKMWRLVFLWNFCELWLSCRSSLTINLTNCKYDSGKTIMGKARGKKRERCDILYIIFILFSSTSYGKEVWHASC